MATEIMDAEHHNFVRYNHPGFDAFDPMKRAHDAANTDPNKKPRVTPSPNHGYMTATANQQPQPLYASGPGPQLTLNTNFGGHQNYGPQGGSPHHGGSPNHNQQPSPQFPPSPNEQAYPNMGAYGFGLMGMSGFGNGFGGLASPNAFAMSPSVGGFGAQQTGQRQFGSTAQTAAVAAAAAAAAAANNQTGRTVYIGNLPADASVDELLNLVHFGPLESVRVLPEKSCVFVSFLDGATAAAFHADANVKKVQLHGNELKIGWGKASPVPSQVLQSIQQSNASRNVYLGGLDEGMTEEMLRDDLSRFGLIDQVKIVRDKNIGFVHFLNISTATKVVATLPTEPAWAGKRVNYGKDRCAYVPKNQHAQPSSAYPPPFSPGFNVALASPATTNFGWMGGMQELPTPTSPAFMNTQMNMGVGGPAVNRTVYLGNIHPETSTEDLCNAIRGGMLQSVRYMQDKHIAFITFVDAGAAFTFYQVATFQGLVLNNRRLKIGWGKNPGSISPALGMAIHGGATRNVYIGNVEDFEVFNEEKLKRDFGEYGEIELVNFLREKNCAFVNFTNISNAIKAIDGIKSKPEYALLRIAHGKDRCANPPRSGPQGGARDGQPNGGRRAMSMGASSFVNGHSPVGGGGYEVHMEGGEGGVPTVTVDGADEVAA